MDVLAQQMMSAQQILPEFKPPGGLEIWELGEKKNWPKLMGILHEFRNFSVNDSRSEGHLRGIARRVGSSRERTHGSGDTILHEITRHDAHNGELMTKDLLALGIKPDPLNYSYWTPAHHCSWGERMNGVNYPEAIGMCRPDLSAKASNGRTAIEITKYHGHTTLWDFVKGGFPAIAQLACDKKWWAVQNLTRRRVVPEAEMFQEFAGKNAIEWADHHREQRIADELRYLLIGDGVNKYFQEWLFKTERQLTNKSEGLEAMLENKLPGPPAGQQGKTEMQSIADKAVTAFGVEVSVDLKALKEETDLSTSKLADELRTFIKAEIAQQSTRAEQDRKIDLQGLEAQLISKVDACQFEKSLAKLDHVEHDMDVVKEGITCCTSGMVEVRGDLEAQMKTADFIKRGELEELEKRLLSKVNSRLDEFQEELVGQMKRLLKARDEIAETQMEAVKRELAKLSIASSAAGVGHSILGVAPHLPPSAICGVLASNQLTVTSANGVESQARGGIRDTSCLSPNKAVENNSALLKDLFALMDKYRR